MVSLDCFNNNEAMEVLVMNIHVDVVCGANCFHKTALYGIVMVMVVVVKEIPIASQLV